MTKPVSQRQIRLMTLLCAAVYFTSYISRINFGAVILEIAHTEGYLKSAVSAAVTISFVTYGAGQLVSGYLGDRIIPRRLIVLGLAATAAMNFLIPFCPDTGSMAVVWGANGFAQALMWPPLVRIMTNVFSGEVYRRASVRVSWGSSLGTIAVYLAAPLCILWSGWKSVFFIASAACILMALVWAVCCGRMERSLEAGCGGTGRDGSQRAEPQDPMKFTPGTAATLCGIMAAIVCQGALRDGVTTWMPSFIAETYHLDNTISILTGVILPVFSIVCFQLTLWLCNRMVRNELLLSGFIFVTGAVCAVFLRLTVSYQPLLSAALSAALTGCMHGVNLLLICMIPPHFARYGKVSTMSGVLNSCTYLGSAASTCGIACLSEYSGWNAVIAAWAAVALAGAVICLAFAGRWEHMRIRE